MDLYETYLRMKDGNTYHLSFNIEGVIITLRRDTFVDADMQFIDKETGGASMDCVVTVRGHATL